MAQEAWVTLSKKSGSNDDSVSVTLSKHTGRKIRSCTFTVQNETGSKPSKKLSISQDAAVLAVIIDTASLDAIATAGNQNFQFRTNAKTFKFDCSRTDGIGVSISTVKINDITLTPVSGVYTIPDDAGAAAEVEVIVKIAISANNTPNSKKGNISVIGSGDEGQADVTENLPITQGAGESTISVSPTSLSFPANGGTKTITITSNDKWNFIE